MRVPRSDLLRTTLPGGDPRRGRPGAEVEAPHEQLREPDARGLPRGRRGRELHVTGRAERVWGYFGRVFGLGCSGCFGSVQTVFGGGYGI